MEYNAIVFLNHIWIAKILVGVTSHYNRHVEQVNVTLIHKVFRYICLNCAELRKIEDLSNDLSFNF